MNYPINEMKGGKGLYAIKKILKEKIKQLRNGFKNYSGVFCRTYEGKTYIKRTVFYLDIDKPIDINKFIIDLKILLTDYYGFCGEPLIMSRFDNDIKKYHIYITNIFITKTNLDFFRDKLISIGYELDNKCPLIRMEGFKKYYKGKYLENSEYSFEDKTKSINLSLYEDLYRFNEPETPFIKELPLKIIEKGKKAKIIGNFKKIKWDKLDISEEKMEIVEKYTKYGDITKNDNSYTISFKSECILAKREHNSNRQRLNIYEDKIYFRCYSDNCKNKEKIVWEKKNNECMIDFEEEKVEIIDIDEEIKEDEEVVDLYEEFNETFINMRTLKKISDMDTDNYGDMKKYVENFYFKINNPACFIDRNGNQINTKDLGHILGGLECKKIIIDGKGKEHIIIDNFLKKWINDIFEIKTYDKYGFYPPNIKPPRNYYNLFDTEKFYKNINLENSLRPETLIYHFEKIICNEDKAVIRFLVNYTYHLIKYPAINPEVFIVLYSTMVGAGKNTFPYILEKLMGGMYFSEVEGEEYFGNSAFNEVEFRKLMIVINEGGANKKSIVEQLKARITNKKKKINRKYEKEIEVNNNIRYILTTNNHKSINVMGKTRRFFLNEVSEEKAGDKDYFNKVFGEINNPEFIKGFWDYILENMDIVDKEEIDRNTYNFQRNIPITKYHTEVITRNTDNFTQYLGYLYYKHINTITDKHIIDYHNGLFKEELNRYVSYNSDEKYKYQHKTIMNKTVELKFKGQYFLFHKTINGNRKYRIDMKILKSYLEYNHSEFFSGLSDFMDSIDI